MRIIIAFFMSLIMVSLSHAITIQHDVDDYRYQDFALNYDDFPEFESVGLIKLKGKGQCSGVLIHPRIVLTAVHCIREQNLESLQGREGILGSFTLNQAHRSNVEKDRNQSALVLGARLLRPEQSKYGKVSDTGWTYQDMVLLVLDHPLSTRRKVEFYQGQKSGDLAGKTGFIVGYGRQGVGNRITLHTDYVKRAGRTQIIRDLGRDIQGDFRWVADVDFLSASTTPGDSGGPLFVKDSRGEKLLLAGILKGIRTNLTPLESLGIEFHGVWRNVLKKPWTIFYAIWNSFAIFFDMLIAGLEGSPLFFGYGTTPLWASIHVNKEFIFNQNPYLEESTLKQGLWSDASLWSKKIMPQNSLSYGVSVDFDEQGIKSKFFEAHIDHAVTVDRDFFVDVLHLEKNASMLLIPQHVTLRSYKTNLLKGHLVLDGKLVTKSLYLDRGILSGGGEIILRDLYGSSAMFPKMLENLSNFFDNSALKNDWVEELNLKDDMIIYNASSLLHLSSDKSLKMIAHYTHAPSAQMLFDLPHQSVHPLLKVAGKVLLEGGGIVIKVPYDASQAITDHALVEELRNLDPKQFASSDQQEFVLIDADKITGDFAKIILQFFDPLDQKVHFEQEISLKKPLRVLQKNYLLIKEKSRLVFYVTK